MKILIWFLCFTAFALFQVVLTSNGVFLGGILSAFLFAIVWSIAKSLCKAWDNRSVKNNTTLTNEAKETFYFENPAEFIMYVNLHKDSNIVWESSDKYVELFKKGFQFFEKRQFIKAINTYKECLKLNPIGISARFELAECYIANKQLTLARKSLYEMKDFLYEDSMKAKFYRRIGYIAIEEDSYEEAYACYIYSLEYEKNPSVIQEIAYILSKVGPSIEDINVGETLAKKQIPLLKSQNYVETSEEKSENTLTQNQEKTYKNNFCRICGVKLNEDAEFCHKCGTKVITFEDVKK